MTDAKLADTTLLTTVLTTLLTTLRTNILTNLLTILLAKPKQTQSHSQGQGQSQSQSHSSDDVKWLARTALAHGQAAKRRLPLCNDRPVDEGTAPRTQQRVVILALLRVHTFYGTIVATL